MNDITTVNKAQQALAQAKTPAQGMNAENVAQAARAWAKEQKDREAYIKSTYIYVMARRRTTELCLPFAPEHGGDRKSNNYKNQDDNVVILIPDVEFAFTPKQWERRKKVLAIPQETIDDYFDTAIAYEDYYPSISGLEIFIKQMDAEEREAARGEIAAAGAKVKDNDKWHVYHGDIATWKAPRQYDFIITDPPYPKEFLPLYEVLARQAVKWLKPGGLLVAMSAHYYMNEIYTMLDKELHYFWTGSYLVPGESAGVFQKHINTQWKPLIMYERKDAHYHGRAFADVFKSDANDKNLHKWGQSESGMLDIISKICSPGQTILDPFCGAGTTLVSGFRYGCLMDGLDLEIKNVNITKGRLEQVTK